MRNTGILLFLVGLYLVINSGSFRDVVLGKADITFLNPKDKSTTTTVGKSEGKFGAGSGGRNDGGK